MKTKIKRHGRSVISVILAVCLLISCMTVGLIATDAANVTDSAIGAKEESEPVGYNGTGHVYTDAGSDYTGSISNNNQFSVTITVANENLSGNNLKIYVKAENDQFGNGEEITIGGSQCNLAKSMNGGILKDAGNYTTINVAVNFSGDVAQVTATGSGSGSGGGSDTFEVHIKGKLNGVESWDSGAPLMTQDTTNPTRYYYLITSQAAETEYFKFYTYDGTNYKDYESWDESNDTDLVVGNNTSYNNAYGAHEGKDRKAFKFSLNGTALIWFEPSTKKVWVETNPLVTITVQNNANVDTFTVTQGSTTITKGNNAQLKKGFAASVVVKMPATSGQKPVKAQVGSTDITLTYNAANDEYRGSFTVPSSNATVSIPGFSDVEYYTIKYSADGFGTVSAQMGDTPIASGTVLREGSTVVFTATPKNEHYSFKGWSGSSTGTATPLTMSFISSNITLKANFEPAKGTANTKYYFTWCEGDSQYINPSDWQTPVAVYLKDGHMYGYIDNVTTNKTYVYSLNEGSEKWHTYFYTNNNPATKTTTSFGGSMDLYQNGNWDYNNVNRKWGAAKITDSNVKGLIIDLGMYDPSNTSNTAYNVVYNVIPVFDTINKVTVYAKNGTLRGANHDVFASKTKTTVSVKHGNTTTAGTQQTRFQTASAVPGDQLVITTQITDTTMNSNYYVKAFSINGVVPQDKLFEESNGTGTNGNTFTYTYTIPADFKESYIEITPVYYLRANNNLNATTTMFYVENYDQTVEDAGWGNTLFVYPFYTAKGTTDVFGADNAFGGYPGQPVIFHKGRRFVQIATTIKLTQANDTNASGKYAAGDVATIKGVTMNNGYWDTVHRDYVSEVYFNHQTYDYDDFYMIYRETTDKTKPEYTKTADEITFSFKYFTTSDNFSTSTGTDANKPNTQSSDTSGKTSYGDISNADDVFQNGWQDLKDYQGNLVDIFGNVLEGSAQTAEPLWVISDGYIATHAGYYATNWAVYNTNKQFITNISPSALLLSSSSRFDDTTKYPSIGTAKDGYPTQKKLSYYKAAYNTLNNANYKNRPVRITYEKSNTNSAYEIGDRCDGRWTFSYYGALIESNIRIDYSTDGGATFTPDAWKAEGSNVGAVTGCSAYFTNTDINIYGKTTTAGVSIRSNPDEEFTFSAQGAGGYVFAGWWLERDGIQTRITENDMLDGSAQRKSSDTYVAKFVQAPSGYCTVRHTVAEDSQGSGDTYVKIVAKKTGEADTVLTQGTDGFTANEFAINPDYIHYKSGYTFTITLKTVPNAYNNFTKFSADGKNDAAAYWSGDTTIDSGVATRSFDVSVDSLFSIQGGLPVQSMKTLDYYSTLSVANISYEINYNFTSRYYEDQTWQETGTFSGKDVGLYVDENDKVKKSFIDSKIPHESDFLKTITWNTAAATTTKSGTTDVKFTVQVSSTKSGETPVYLKVTLPYEYEYAADKYFTPKLTDDKPTITETEDITLEAVYGQQYYYFKGDTKVEKIIEALDKYTVDGQEAPMVFKYWKITNKDNALVTKIYDRNLKIIAYGNYNATPVYMAKGSADEIAETRTSLASTSINYIDSSRNQWNVAGKGSAGSSMNKADRLYADFALKYDYHNLLFRDLASNGSDPKIQTGMIIEVLGDLEDASNGIGKNTNLEYYRTKYAETGTDTTSITNLKKYIKGKSGYTGYDTDSYNYDSNNNKISSVFVPLYTNITDTVYTKPFTVNAENNQYNIDNRNGVHYTYGVANRKNNTLSELTNKNKIFRAYSYMIVNGEVYVSDAPTYFELYTEGSK